MKVFFQSLIILFLIKLYIIYYYYIFIFYFSDSALKYFYEFGPKAHDYALLKDDDHHYLIEKGIDFKYFDKFYSAFYLSTNGICELVANENKEFSVSENPKDFPILEHALIAPFWADITTEIAGDVFYRLENDSETLDQISCDIKKTYFTFSHFKATWAAIITWNQVKAHAYSRFRYFAAIVYFFFFCCLIIDRLDY